MGGAAEIALACDRVLCQEGARFSFPEIRIGAYPPVAIPMLTHRAGHGRATRAILSGEDLPLEELSSWGLIGPVAKKGELDKAVEDEVALYAGQSPTVLGMTARLLHDEAYRAWGERIDHVEEEYLEKLLPQADAAEGIRAFEEKRDPVWKSLDDPIDLDQVEGMAQ